MINDELDYGPIIVTKGKFKGRIGYLDDEEGIYGYVYWGNMVEVLDTCHKIKLSYLSNDISMHAIINRVRYLSKEISRLRALSLNCDNYDENLFSNIVEMYGEYIYAYQLLVDYHIENFYLHSESDKNIFISHSSNENALALEIAIDLKKAGYNVWLDSINLKLGQSVPREISKRLEEADALIMLVSEKYKQSMFCNDEWEAFYMIFNRSKPNAILPIMIEDAEPPTLLAAKKYFRYDYNYDRYNQMLLELKQALKNLNI